MHLAAHLGDDVLRTTLEGDGAGTLVQAWASRHPDGALMTGDPRLDRSVRVTISGLGGIPRRAWLARVDDHHSDVAANCPAEVTWPDAGLWTRLRASDGLHEEQLRDVTPDDGAVCFDVEPPMPGIIRIRPGAGPGGPPAAGGSEYGRDYGRRATPQYSHRESSVSAATGSSAPQTPT